MPLACCASFRRRGWGVGPGPRVGQVMFCVVVLDARGHRLLVKSLCKQAALTRLSPPRYRTCQKNWAVQYLPSTCCAVAEGNNV